MEKSIFLLSKIINKDKLMKYYPIEFSTGKLKKKKKISQKLLILVENFQLFSNIKYNIMNPLHQQ